VTEGALRGLVIDWGGVLTASLDGATAAWVAHDGVRYEHFRDVMRSWVRPPGSPALGPPGTPAGAGQDEPVAEVEQADDDGPAGTSPVHRLERGEMAPAEFEVALAAELGRRGSPVEARGLLRRMLGGLDVLEDDMLGLVRRAREAGIRTALLSNSWGDNYPEQLWDGLFEAMVISGRVGMRKPESRIFRHTCALLDLAPSACVMVDDLPHNIAGAVSVGMVGVLHTDYGTTAEELEVLFGIPLR
jgi:HAD superfamily hydrolase (TIGR01509 family)